MIKVHDMPNHVSFDLDTILRPCSECECKRSLITDPQETLTEMGQYIRLFVDKNVSSNELLKWFTEGVMSRD